MKKLMTPKDAAEYLGVGLTTLWRMATNGNLPFVQIPGRHRRYDKSDLDKIIEQYKRSNTQLGIL